MCTNPLRLRNPGLSNNPGLFYLDVPCGSCKECQEVKSIDFFLRAFSIFRSLPTDWSCFFVTMTHRPEDVPHSDFYSVSVSDDAEIHYNKVFENCVCFNHELIHKAMKSLNQYYRRKFPNDYHYKTYPSGRVVKIYDKVPKYLITSEFGESSDGQHLPHYHGLIFVAEKLNFKQFKELFEKYWTYGFTKDIKIHKFKTFINDRSPENCIKYVVKYASKGVGFMPEWLKRKSELIPSLGDWYHVEPRIFTSNGFGDSLERLLDVSNYETNKITLSVAGKYCSYNLPSYYSRRYFTQSEVVSKDKQKISEVIYPFRVVKSRTLYRKTQITHYVNDYLRIKKGALINDLSKKWFSCRLDFLEMKPEFQDFLCSQKGYSNELRELVLNTDCKSFVDAFMKVKWSDMPVFVRDPVLVSRPTLDIMPKYRRIGFNICQLVEQGFGNSTLQKQYNMYLPYLKNLPSYIKYVDLSAYSNKDYCVHDPLSPDLYSCDFINRVFELSYALDLSSLFHRILRRRLQDKKMNDENEYYNKLV